ncbi:hypothetical protein [Owenweeksia hongkongensis]|uniref:hypothetical protein n=1 Tax=Owenweeksia hongkongensis TaxID=253245 RepID=UPI003A9224DD
MRSLLTTLLLLISIFCFSQKLKQGIENLPFYIHSGCDTINHKIKEGFVPGELPMKIEIESAKRKPNGQLNIIGVLKTKTSNEPLPDAKIFVATFKKDYCKIHHELGTTNNQGKFELTFSNHQDLSIFFTSPSYIGLELKIGDLEK